MSVYHILVNTFVLTLLEVISVLAILVLHLVVPDALVSVVFMRSKAADAHS